MGLRSCVAAALGIHCLRQCVREDGAVDLVLETCFDRDVFALLSEDVPAALKKDLSWKKPNTEGTQGADMGFNPKTRFNPNPEP